MNLTIEEIASIAHDLNREYCEFLNDNSQQYWERAPKWQKESCIEGVKDIVEGKTLTFEDQHNSWMKWKLETGWKYGPVKNAELKEHPCLVHYKDLPLKDQIKDELFRGVVTALSKLLVK